LVDDQLRETVERNIDHIKLLFTELDHLNKDSPAQRKGDLLEKIAERFFDSKYLRFYRNKVRNVGEIDVVFEVKRIELTIFHNFSDSLLIECKNWSDKVGSSEIQKFKGKMLDVKSKVGIMVTKSPITKPAKDAIKYAYLSNSVAILVFTRQDIMNVLRDKNLYRTLKNKYYETTLLTSRT